MEKNHQRHQPIGVFDSGIGGLTVANAIIKHLPEEEIIYFGDTFHLPYGDKSADAIRYYSLKIVKFLLEKNCKMIVIACNSASSAAYNVLLDFFKGQALFVNVVDPLVDAVIEKQYSHVGIIATKATIRSDIYRSKLQAAQPNLKVSSMATPLLVPIIEEGYFNDNISEAVIEKYLSHKSIFVSSPAKVRESSPRNSRQLQTSSHHQDSIKSRNHRRMNCIQYRKVKL